MSLKKDIERDLGLPVRLRAGAPGSFVVFLDGQQIFSKKQAGHSPNPVDIIKTIREKAG